MIRKELRTDKKCQNCGCHVEQRFCPDCGQENVETRQSFSNLFLHFVSDFVHYDSHFWKTIKYLLFYPGKLTKEYLAGKRKSYVQPVQLYIFISFLVFFIPTILPDQQRESVEEEEVAEEQEKDPDQAIFNYTLNVKNAGIILRVDGVTIQYIDSVKQVDPERISDMTAGILKMLLKSRDAENKIDITELFMHNLPKILFLYMPLFALWLWVFHNKKKWFYFDHGIFTLHYFSLSLLSILLFLLIKSAFGLFTSDILGYSITFLIAFLYIIFYFFYSYKQFYKEKRTIFWLKSISLFLINGICILLLLVLYTITITFISIM
jgi:hypothetical protein